MRLLADAWLDVRVAEWLRSPGHDVRHLRDEGLQRLPDVAVFDNETAEDRIVLTFDLAFAEIAAFSGGRNVGPDAPASPPESNRHAVRSRRTARAPVGPVNWNVVEAPSARLRMAQR